jgi:hypothetical protein
VAPVVVIVMLVSAVLIHNVGEDEGDPAVLVALIVKLLELSEATGLLALTWILYNELVVAFEGIVRLTSLPVSDLEPVMVNEVNPGKLPAASLNSMIKLFPVLNWLPPVVVLKVVERVLPAQDVEGVETDVILCPNNWSVDKTKNVPNRIINFTRFKPIIEDKATANLFIDDLW